MLDKINARIGFMQGRLTKPKDKLIQSFPFENWKNEFSNGRKLGFGNIVFLFDDYRCEENPLSTDKGLVELQNICEKTGMNIASISVDYFMHKPFTASKKQADENIEILKKLILKAKILKIPLIEIPLLDNSSINNTGYKDLIISKINTVLPFATQNDVKLAFETDLPPKRFLAFIKKFDAKSVGIVYDSGNSAFSGYNPAEELALFGKYITNVHIKDRILNGHSVELGQGGTDFDALFKALRTINYSGKFILQVARGNDGEEEKTLVKQRNFVVSLIEKYLI